MIVRRDWKPGNLLIVYSGPPFLAKKVVRHYDIGPMISRLAAALLFLFVGSGIGAPLTLEEAHRMAVKRAESIAQYESTYAHAQAEYRRRRSALYPSLAFDVREFVQDVPPAPPGGVGTTLTRRDRPEVDFELQQNVFAGFRDYYATRGARLSSEAEKARKERAIQLLYEDTARAFYGLMGQDRQLEILRQKQEVLGKVLSEVVRLVRIGRERSAERTNVLAQQKNNEAEIATAERIGLEFRFNLAFLLGQEPPNELLEPPSMPLPATEVCSDDFLKRRPDLVATRQLLAASEQETKSSKGGYWPTVDLGARYYLYRVGYLSDIDWDFNVLFRMPLFEGGRTKAEVDQAKARQSFQELELARVYREACNELARSYAQLESDRKRANVLAEAVKQHEENFRLQQRDYRLGLVKNLDVLTSLSDLFDARRFAEQAQMGLRVREAEWSVTRGALPHTL